MKINILTIFPEMFTPLTSSMLGRAAEAGLLEFNIVDIRSFSRDKHHKTDDYTFGGGQGLVFMAEPAFDAMRSVGAERTRNIYLSPRGRILDGKLASELAEEEEMTLFCGHYEGIDQRIIDRWNMEEVSIGDYIMTGGELAAMVLIDVFARLIPGVLPKEESALEESVYSGLLEYPHYTRPEVWHGRAVPEVLLSGDHAKIEAWRYERSLERTALRRPDLLEKSCRIQCIWYGDEAYRNLAEKVTGALSRYGVITDYNRKKMQKQTRKLDERDMLVLILPQLFPLVGLPGAYGLAIAQAASDGFSFLFLALPLAIRIFRQIGDRPDGAEPLFASTRRSR